MIMRCQMLMTILSTRASATLFFVSQPEQIIQHASGPQLRYHAGAVHVKSLT